MVQDQSLLVQEQIIQQLLSVTILAIFGEPSSPTLMLPDIQDHQKSRKLMMKMLLTNQQERIISHYFVNSQE